MSNLQENKNINYDDEPVEYCSRCYSLKIVHEDSIDADCCMECGSTDISSASIDTWEKLYEKRYGRKFVERNNDPRTSIYFKLSESTLKTKLYQDKKLLKTVIYKLYPKFPEGLSREEEILVLFDRLCKDNRMDELRTILYEYYKVENSSH